MSHFFPASAIALRPCASLPRAVVLLALLASLCLGAAGCHRQKVPVLPPVQAQVPLLSPPESTKPVIIEPQPLPPQPAIVVKPARRQRRKPTVAAKPAVPGAPPAPAVPGAPSPTSQAPAVQVASAGTPPDASVIGALTAGGDASPEKHQQATDLLADIAKRLAALPAASADEQKMQVAQVKNFVRQSQIALEMGDTEGALQLAIKAKLLLDDLSK